MININNSEVCYIWNLNPEFSSQEKSFSVPLIVYLYEMMHIH